MIGYGTYCGDKPENIAAMEQATRDAIAAGYRSIDTAEEYKSMPSVGLALQSVLHADDDDDSKVAREDLFITGKLSGGLVLEYKDAEDRTKVCVCVFVFLFCCKVKFLFSWWWWWCVLCVCVCVVLFSVQPRSSTLKMLSYLFLF